MKHLIYLGLITLFMACNQTNEKKELPKDDFKYFLEKFADLKIIRYQIPGFDSLSLNQKKLVYYLSQAALCGRDILWDQHYKNNLEIRQTLETILEGYSGDRNTADFSNFIVYLKRVWFSNGIHHHYSTEKIMPEFTSNYFLELISGTPDSLFKTNKNELANKLIPILFDPKIDSKRVNLDPDKGLITGSATNFYEGVNEKEVEDFYSKMKDEKDKTPIEYGLNSKLVKENNIIIEKVWKINGMYSKAIEKIIYWLNKASTVAENEIQKQTILKLIDYYTTGNLKTWDEYNINWVSDNISEIDFVNGFIEVYGDPIGKKGTWESIVNFKDIEATKRTKIISENAQWFENHSPIENRFKKEKVTGISAKVIVIAQLAGDCYPSSPIGINLPNSNWVRQAHGSKSVTLSNIIHAHHQSSLQEGTLEEFAYNEEQIKRAKEYGGLATDLHVDMHECLGHGSGKVLPGISNDHLKNYHSTIEEARADLFALYYIMDIKLIELGLIPSLEVGKAEYDGYIRSGLMTQLTRIEEGKDLEESHMRNRQLIAKWVYEKGHSENIIEKIIKDKKTYFVIHDYTKLHYLFGELLKEIQRIKSEGDYEGAKNLVENYGVKIDKELHKEILERYKKLNLAPYSGFINPILVPIEKDGEITNIIIEYKEDYTEQMLFYSKNYSFLK